MSIVSVQVGLPVKVPFERREVSTGIYKCPADRPLRLGRVNFEGDAQADLVNHGGPDKAVCVYPFEHYAMWTIKLNAKFSPGAFGENVTLAGVSEEAVCIGDIFALGGAAVQISQPRQPCFKLALRHGIPDLPLLVQNEGATGYYFRVLEEGFVAAGDRLERLERHPLGVTVAFANRIKYQDKNNRKALETIIAVDALSENWRESMRKRLRETDAAE